MASSEPQSSWRCPQCQIEYAAPAKFCSACGRALHPAQARGRLAEAAGERRHITTMFCDIIGSTALSLSMDPEKYARLIQAYRDICSHSIANSGGVINKFMGDGILACFGYPRSHEDDAARACRAGLQIIGSMQQALPNLKVRIAAATGLVVSSDMVVIGAVEQHSMVGWTLNLAARLQERAPPGGMLIADETRLLVGEGFELQDFGSHELKGVDRPVRAWRVAGERRVESRFAARSWVGDDRLFGRQQELDVLLERWRSTRAGSGQLVMIYGEPGIGKSRLVHELRDRVAQVSSTTLLFQCASDQASSTLHPVTAHLAFAARITGKDSPAEKLDKLRALFGDYPEGARSLLPLMAELLAIPMAEADPAPDLTPAQRKARTLAALTDWMMHLAGRKPLLLVIEDYHWIDPTTAEWLDLALPRLETMPVLCTVTSRYERVEQNSPASHHGHAAELALSRLGHDESIQLITHLAAGKALPIEMVNAIMARTEGVPLFVEALTKSVLDSTLLSEREDGFVLNEPLEAVGIPMTLHDLLSARLDSLGPSKAVAQLGSVLGRSFTYEMLARLSEGPEDTLREALSRLVSADLLIAGGEVAEAGYTFKHALIQNAAYEGLLLSRRRSLHGQVARVLAAHSPEAVEAHPEQLAFHLTRAENFVDAACQWRRAGVLSAQRSANREAVLHFESALAMLERIPTATRDKQQELDALIGLTGALRATRGYAAPEVGDASRRALQLARSLGSDLGELQALNSIYSFYLVAAQYAEAEAAAQELREVAVRAGQDTYAMIGHRAVGAVSFHRGRLREAEESLQHALSLYDPERHAYLTTLYGSNHAETCACFLSLTKFALGKQSEAVNLQSWAVEHSRAINHAHSLAQALAYRGFLFCLAGDPERIEADSRSAMTLAGEHRLKLMETFAICTMTVAQATRAPSPERIAELEEAIARLHGLARNALRPFLLSLTAELCRRAGMIERGLALLDEADATIRQTTERWAEAEGRRVRGRLLADSGAIGAAETCFREAIAIAESQAAGSWRVRAATDLASLLRRCGSSDGANAASETASDEIGFALGSFGAWETVDTPPTEACLRNETALRTDRSVDAHAN